MIYSNHLGRTRKPTLGEVLNAYQKARVLSPESVNIYDNLIATFDQLVVDALTRAQPEDAQAYVEAMFAHAPPRDGRLKDRYIQKARRVSRRLTPHI